MFTVKRIIQGDVSLSSLAEVTVSRNGGKLFKEAVRLALNPSSNLEIDLASPSVGGEDGITVQGTVRVTGSLVDGVDYAQEIVNVQERRSTTSIMDAPYILTGVAPGCRHVSEAIGVLVWNSHTEDEVIVDYDFFYRGDEVYVMNSEGKTVYDLR